MQFRLCAPYLANNFELLQKRFKPFEKVTTNAKPATRKQVNSILS